MTASAQAEINLKTRRKANMSFKSFMDKAKRAPKKNLAMAAFCAVACIGLLIYFLTIIF